MSETKELLETYLELYDVSEKEKKAFIKSKAIQMYILLRDMLTYAELVELQIVLNNIYYGEESEKKIDFGEYIHINKNKLDKEKIKSVCEIFDLETCPHTKKAILTALGTIIAMEPKDVVINYITKNE